MPVSLAADTKKDSSGKKVCAPPDTWAVRCTTGHTIRGFADVSFSFLEPWLGNDLGQRFLIAIRRNASRYRSAAQTFDVRLVLDHWRSLRPLGNTLEGMPTVSLISELGALRLGLFTADSRRGVHIKTTAAKWSSFLTALPSFFGAKALPQFDVKNPRVRRIPDSLVNVARTDTHRIAEAPGLAPRTFDKDADSYNDCLLENLSIAAGGVDYLNEYERRLSKALETIRSAAMRDFERLEAMSDDKMRLLRLSKHLLGRAAKGETLLKNVPMEDLAHAAPSEITIGLLLHFVDKQMNGVPKAWAVARAYASRKPDHVAKLDCQKLASFGKNQLLPYLGILTSEAALICAILLMFEHPSLNSTTLLRAQMVWPGGRRLLTSQSTRGQAIHRLNATKPRAGTERSVLLTPLSKRVLDRVIAWTRSARSELIERGDETAANRLWVGMTLRDYKCVALSHSAIASGFRRELRSLGVTAEQGRLQSLVEKHPELEPWADRLNLANLRKNIGVLKYLESGGDAAQAASVFGNSVQTTLDDYIPAPLRNAIYEREIRRHQNLLISAAFGKRGPPLEATDFTTIAELHHFLETAFTPQKDDPHNPIANALRGFLEVASAHRSSEPPKHHAWPSRSRVVLNADPKYLCTAMLYRDHLSKASDEFLDCPDPGTKVAPRFWVDFVNGVEGGLPNSHAHVKRIVASAETLKSTYRAHIAFPPIW